MISANTLPLILGTIMLYYLILAVVIYNIGRINKKISSQSISPLVSPGRAQQVKNKLNEKETQTSKKVKHVEDKPASKLKRKVGNPKKNMQPMEKASPIITYRNRPKSGSGKYRSAIKKDRKTVEEAQKILKMAAKRAKKQKKIEAVSNSSGAWFSMNNAMGAKMRAL